MYSSFVFFYLPLPILIKLTLRPLFSLTTTYLQAIIFIKKINIEHPKP